MNIYIDESGPFGGLKKNHSVDQAARSHYNTLVALAIPERNEVKLSELLAKTKEKFGNGREVKLNDFADNEEELLHFFARLGELEVVAYYSAVDISKFTHEMVEEQRKETIDAFENASRDEKDFKKKSSIQKLKGIFQKFKAPLFLQLFLQMALTHEIVHKGINFYALRDPSALSSFNWYLDTKENKDYLFAYKHYAAYLCSRLNEDRPYNRVAGGNYEHIDKIYGRYPKPNIFVNDVKKPVNWNLERILTQRISYVDSKMHPGIQAADLIASSFRRCLAEKFKDNVMIAAALGSFTTKDERGEIGTGGLYAYGANVEIDPSAKNCLRIMHFTAS